MDEQDISGLGQEKTVLPSEDRGEVRLRGDNGREIEDQGGGEASKVSKIRLMLINMV